jgi:ubiquinone/menaquinone biosynthesis C-methylase UbiE
MKMRWLEKRFVNSAKHGERVAARAEQRLRWLGPAPGERLLDVGCGTGAATIHLARTLALETVGIDVDPDQIDAARKAAGEAHASFQVADATALPFSDSAFDLVYTNKTTHHIPHWPQAIAEMARVLAPGGKLIYADFVAPFGKRLPTRRGIDATALEHGLVPMSSSRSPLHFAAVYDKPRRSALASSVRGRNSGSPSVRFVEAGDSEDA